MRRHFPSVWGLKSVDSAAGLLRGGISSVIVSLRSPQDCGGTTYICAVAESHLFREILVVRSANDIQIVSMAVWFDGRRNKYNPELLSLLEDIN